MWMEGEDGVTMGGFLFCFFVFLGGECTRPSVHCGTSKPSLYRQHLRPLGMTHF